MRKQLGVAAGAVAGTLLLILTSPLVGRGGPAVDEGTKLTATKAYPDMQVLLEPVPSGYEAKVPASEAVDLAQLMHDDEYESATSVVPTLALYTNMQVVACDQGVVECESESGTPLIEDLPAWVVDIEGLCAEFVGGFILGGERSDTGCIPQTRHVVVNADTGELIEDWGE